jgi:hypothetical protein
MEYELSKDTAGIYLHKNIKQLDVFIKTKIKEISSSKNSRTIVLETWLVVDWLVRQLIISGIKCLELQNSSYNPHYSLLPNSFRECLEILKNLKSSQEKLETLPPKNFTGLKGDYGIWAFIKEESIETYEKIIELQKQYQKKIYKIESENFVVIEQVIDYDKYRFVSNEWLESLIILDDKWFKSVIKLNKARNTAAHVFNEDEIYTDFGISGLKKQELLRKECVTLLTLIVGLIPKLLSGSNSRQHRINKFI